MKHNTLNYDIDKLCQDIWHYNEDRIHNLTLTEKDFVLLQYIYTLYQHFINISILFYFLKKVKQKLFYTRRYGQQKQKKMIFVFCFCFVMFTVMSLSRVFSPTIIPS